MYGKRIALLRSERGLTQRALSQTLKIATSTISMYEQENREPDLAIIIKIAEHFNVSVDFLLGVTNERGRYGNNLLISSDDERSLLETYRALDNVGRGEVRGYILGYAAKANNEK